MAEEKKKRNLIQDTKDAKKKGYKGQKRFS